MAVSGADKGIADIGQIHGLCQGNRKAPEKEGFRCEVDGRAEKIGYKIRAARLERIPYMLVVGEKEVETDSVSVRSRDDGDLGSMSINRLLEILRAD